MSSPLVHTATTLREALNALDPERHLRTPEELDRFFVDRPKSPASYLRILLQDTDEPQKILFSGHRGSGKSTELSRVARDLGDEFITIRYSAHSILNPFDLRYVDVVLSIGLQLFETAAEMDLEEDLHLNEDVIRHVLDFTKVITKEEVDESKAGFEASLGLKTLVASLTGKLSTQDTTRRSVRSRLETRVSDLLESIDVLARELQDKTERKILVIIEDLDKTDLATARSLFYEHARPLATPPVSVIYTFPIALRHDEAYMQIKMNFPQAETLPNIKTETREGERFEPGIDTVRSILTHRVEAALFDEDALDALARLSSGIPREVIALARQAVVETIRAGDDQVSLDAVESAVTRRKQEYEILLSNAQRRLLHDVHTTKAIDNEEVYRELLHNLSVLEYTNDRVWYDVHPLARDLMLTTD